MVTPLSREAANALHVLPFYKHSFKYTKWHIVRMGLAGLFSIPRLCLVPVAILPPYILSFLSNTHKIWHNCFLKTTKWSARLILMICGIYHIKVNDKHLDQFNPSIYISNHTSPLDYLVMLYCAPQVPAFVCQHYIQQIPIVGRIASSLQTLFTINNDSSVDIFKINPSKPLAVFPEGTTTNGLYVISFKAGAFTMSQSVLPMTIEYSCGCSNESLDSFALFYALFTRFYHHCEVTVHPSYVPSEKEARDPLLYASNMQSYIADKLGVPTYSTSLGNQIVYKAFRTGRIDYSEAYSRIYDKEHD